MNKARLAPMLDRPRHVLVCLCLALWLPGFFTLPPTDRDESRFALATRQMVDTGDFVRIMNGAVPRSKKPIGIHWLQAPFAAAARAAGVARDNPIWPYRIASLLGGMLAVLATFDIAETLLPDRRSGLWGENRTGLLAGALLAASVIVTVETHLAKTDAALLGVTTLAMAVLARAWAGARVGASGAAVFWAALGAGILIKGPVAPLIVGLAAATAMLSRRGRDDGESAESRLAWLRSLRPMWGVPLMVLVVLPWFVAIGIDTHGGFFRQAVGGDLEGKLAGGAEGHGAPPGLHLLLLPLLCFPGTVPVLQGLAAAFVRRREPAIMFLLCWLVPGWLLFEAVPTKLPHYTMPLYPALCVLAADALTRERVTAGLAALAGKIGMQTVADRAAAAIRAMRFWRAAARLLLVLVCVALAGAAMALPLILHAGWWLGVPAAILVWPAAIFAWRARPLGAAVCAVPLYAALLQYELPRLSSLWISPRAEAALRAAWPGVPADGHGVFAVGYAEPSLMFLIGPRLHWLPDGVWAGKQWAVLPHAAAFISTPEVAAFEAASLRAGVAAVPGARIDGVDYARGKSVELRLFVH
jgi:4-amino-4-deoxy-L-arabinose transferase-like glycosyltransferase